MEIETGRKAFVSKDIKILHSPCRHKMGIGKIALTLNVEQLGILGSTFEQNAGSIPALAIRGKWEQEIQTL